jgi:CheY-like chemotaxis protein
LLPSPAFRSATFAEHAHRDGIVYQWGRIEPSPGPPTAPARSLAGGGGSGGEPGSAVVDILIVEDEPSLRRAVAEALSDEGYRVTGARDGVDALRVLAHTRPWLILLDMRLPVMDGRDFVREIRNRGIGSKIVVMTGSQDARRMARELDADAYIAKPFELDDLIEIIDRHRPGGG